MRDQATSARSIVAAPLKAQRKTEKKIDLPY
jgi:hypothetical protein